MKKVKILFCNEISLEDKRRVKLDYYLTECYAEQDESQPYYGVGIDKYLEGEVETEEVLGISHSKDKVVAILKKLFQHTVTPLSMIEILDDLMSEAYYT